MNLHQSERILCQEKMIQELQLLLKKIRFELHSSAPHALHGSSIVQLANFLLSYGRRLCASDVHIEPQEKDIRVRYRIDGLLWECPVRIPSNIGDNLTSRFKVMGGMDSAQKTRPLDGSISFESKEGTLDIRVSTIPSIYGETIVLRLMDLEERLLRMDELGFTPTNLKALRELIHRPSGLVILAGPMNSGKTTTLYAALSELNQASTSLMTLEDPIERKITGITQVQVNEKAGLDYIAGLRAVLRQDAEKILLGEIRDAKTAQMAVRIALTGHLLMTSIHASNAVSVIYRLLEMEVEPYLLAETLEGIIGQRLVRRVASHPDSAPSSKTLCPDESQLQGSSSVQYEGRLALQEVLLISDEMRELILLRAPRHKMEEAARRAHLITLEEDGVQKTKLGLTTEEEVRRVLYGNGDKSPFSPAAV